MVHYQQGVQVARQGERPGLLRLEPLEHGHWGEKLGIGQLGPRGDVHHGHVECGVVEAVAQAPVHGTVVQVGQGKASVVIVSVRRWDICRRE